MKKMQILYVVIKWIQAASKEMLANQCDIIALLTNLQWHSEVSASVLLVYSGQ